MRLLTLLIGILLVSTQALATTLQEQSVVEARKYLQVREYTNNNDAPEIDMFLKYLGLPKRLSWCAAYTIYAYKDAADTLQVPQPIPKYGRVATLYAFYKKNPIRGTVISIDQVRTGLVKLRPGDLVIWKHGTTSTDNFNGHIGILITQLSNTSIRTIEGNTLPESTGNKGNQREGGGVYVRNRYLAPGSFKIIGFIRVK